MLKHFCDGCREPKTEVKKDNWGLSHCTECGDQVRRICGAARRIAHSVQYWRIDSSEMAKEKLKPVSEKHTDSEGNDYWIARMNTQQLNINYLITNHAPFSLKRAKVTTPTETIKCLPSQAQDKPMLPLVPKPSSKYCKRLDVPTRKRGLDQVDAENSPGGDGESSGDSDCVIIAAVPTKRGKRALQVAAAKLLPTFQKDGKKTAATLPIGLSLLSVEKIPKFTPSETQARMIEYLMASSRNISNGNLHCSTCGSTTPHPKAVLSCVRWPEDITSREQSMLWYGPCNIFGTEIAPEVLAGWNTHGPVIENGDSTVRERVHPHQRISARALEQSWT